MPPPRSLRSLCLILSLTALGACGGSDHAPGEIQGARRETPPDPAGRRAEKSILFGDLHVHTTYSIDAFIYALPLFGGSGVHPPADACDFARHCSQLDFFSITDHAESLTPERWKRLNESTRQCNARAGDPANPDLVSFVGWEWTQAGFTPETHFGHKNVIFPDLGPESIPSRPINSLPDRTFGRAAPGWVLRGAQALLAPFSGGAYADFLWLIEEMAGTPECELGVDVRTLPDDCMENAPTPAVLFEKLRQWGFETLVIPHGLAWGIHAPVGARLDLQIDPANHDPALQRLLEVYSGHGSSEEFRAWPDDWPQRSSAADGASCPAPTAGRLACCWQAGEIMRKRCGDLPAAECERRVEEARRLALAAGPQAQRVFPDAPPEEWLDCDQCRDCFKPVYDLRPGMSAQYALALGGFAANAPPGADGTPPPPARFRFGLIASSDDHKAQPGTGYKQIQRRRNSDARGLESASLDAFLRPRLFGRSDDPRQPLAVPERHERGFGDLMDVERVASFLYPGGLVAAHASGRDRRSIWDALQRREVYGTSGPRILLWFDLVGPNGTRLPMGSETALATTPRFEVRALGDRRQQPGCSPSAGGLGAERLQQLCAGECYNPGDSRVPIEAIEVIRIRPQQHAAEAIAPRIEDPWRRFDCPPDPAGCSVHFEDPDFVAGGRDSVYYVRALQQATPAINGANLRTRFDADGNATLSEPCFANHRSDDSDDCLAPVQERAWSSPIFVDRTAR